MSRRRALVTGAGGRVGAAVGWALQDHGWEVTAAARRDLDVVSRSSVEEALRLARPSVVVNAAAYTDVDGCQADPDRARRVNAEAVGTLTKACADVGAHLLHLSSDYVFGGELDRPYREDDVTGPLSVYGVTKRDGEVLAGPSATVIRSAWLVGRRAPNVVHSILELAATDDRPLRFVSDQVGSPTLVDDLVATLVALADERLAGVVHVSNGGSATWHELAVHVLDVAGFDPGRVEPISRADLDRPGDAPRPSNSALEDHALAEAGWPPLRQSAPTRSPNWSVTSPPEASPGSRPALIARGGRLLRRLREGRGGRSTSTPSTPTNGARDWWRTACGRRWNLPCGGQPAAGADRLRPSGDG